MLKGLGFGKKRPPTDAQIRRHREQMHMRTQWKDDVTRIQGISAKLAHTYTNHKGDFALGRYEELKQMIKEALKEYHDLTDKSHKNSRDSATSAMAAKYSGNSSAGSHGNGGSASQSADNGGGLFAKLKKKAVDFASSASSSTPEEAPVNKEEQKEKEMQTWGYEGRSGKQVEEEAESFRKEVLQLKADFRTERDKFERLAKDYEDSKKHAPPQRYTVLKFMIKDHIGA